MIFFLRHEFWRSRHAVWCSLTAIALALGGCRQAETASVDASPDVIADVPTDVRVDAALDVSPDSDAAADETVAIPVGCPPDPLPSWVPPVADPALDKRLPGLTCAFPGWPGPAAAQPLVWTAAPNIMTMPAGVQLDRCLLWEDVNNDGKEDLIFLFAPQSVGGKRTLVVGFGQTDGTLKTQQFATQLSWEPMDCTVADLQHDGKPELLIPALPGFAIMELTGPQAGTDVTAQFTTKQFPFNGAIASFDMDADGDEDVYLAGNQNYNITKGNFACMNTDLPYTICCLSTDSVPCMQTKVGQKDLSTCCAVNPPASPHSFLRNDGGKLVDVSDKFALDTGAGMTVSPRDIDRDGRMDFFLGNDFGHHAWYINRTTSFAFLTTAVGMRPYGHVMGSAIVDFDGDHRDDLMIADWGPTTFYKGTDKGFVDVSEPWGIWKDTDYTINWSQQAVDLDRDGRLDLVTTTSLHTQEGHFTAVENEDAMQFAPGYHIVAQNTGTSFKFQHLPWEGGADPGVTSVSGTAGDFDHDGDLDLFLITSRGMLSIWRNDTKPVNHWINVHARDAVGPVRGALVQVWAQGYAQESRVADSTGWGTHLAPVAHFGLGIVSKLDLVRVWWPSGQVTDVKAPAIDQELVVQKPL